MKIIEALKKVKYNREKMVDLARLIKQNAANMESQKGNTAYADPKRKIREWVQSVHDLQNDNAKLLAGIQRTNLTTKVTIEVEEGKPVTKTIAEWITRRREGVDQDYQVYSCMTTGLKQQTMQDAQGNLVVDNVVYNFSTEERDKKLMILSEEKSRIDSVLEIVNATTDLVD